MPDRFDRLKFRLDDNHREWYYDLWRSRLTFMTIKRKRVTRVIVVEGDPEWVDKILAQSLLKEKGEGGVKIMRPGCVVRCDGITTEHEEIER